MLLMWRAGHSVRVRIAVAAEAGVIAMFRTDERMVFVIVAGYASGIGYEEMPFCMSV